MQIRSFFWPDHLLLPNTVMTEYIKDFYENIIFIFYTKRS